MKEKIREEGEDDVEDDGGEKGMWDKQENEDEIKKKNRKID